MLLLLPAIMAARLPLMTSLQYKGNANTPTNSAIPFAKLMPRFCSSSSVKTRTVPFFFGTTLPLESLKSNFRPCRVATVRVVAQSDFADHEAARFRDGLLKMLADDENIGELRVPMVDTCTKIFRQFAMSYKGELPIDPFLEMRHALEGQGIPFSKVSKVTRGALGWSRYNLYHDWKKWSTAN